MKALVVKVRIRVSNVVVQGLQMKREHEEIFHSAANVLYFW